LKKIIATIIVTVLFITAMSGCGKTPQTEEATQAPTQSATTAPTQAPTQAPTVPVDETDPPAATENPNKEPGTFHADVQYEDATQSATQNSSNKTGDINAKNYFSGVWSPVKAESVASGKEVTFTEAFGSSYNTYGGALNIYEDNYFEVGMGSYNEEKAHQGFFAVSGTTLNATYDDGIKDTFTYIANYNGKEAVKVKLGDYYVYFAR